MHQQLKKKRRVVLEMCLLFSVICTTWLFYFVTQHRAAVLHLYFLPVVLAGLYLNRSRTTHLVLLSVALVCTVTSLASSRVMPGDALDLAVPGLIVWATTIGLAGLVVVTLTNLRHRRLQELSESQQLNTLTDALTGVANRRVFQYELARRLSEWNRRRTPVALVLLDIDNFKKFNDTYGHQVGDVVLRGVARAAQSAVREVDLVARYGGEEFAIVLPGTDLADAKEATERVRRAVETRQFECGRLTFRLTVSVGLAHVLPDENAESLIRRADGALYHSKQAGRNCAHWHNGTSCEHFGTSLPSIATNVDELDQLQLTESEVYTDRLTGLPRKKVFHEELRRRVSETHRYKTHLSVLFVEVDDFDNIKALGAQAAKMVMATVAEFLVAALRESDLVTRYTENQLGVMLPVTPLDEARVPADRIRQRVTACTSVVCHGTLLSFSVSIGLGELAANEEASSLLERVQAEVRKVSAGGGNGLHTLTPPRARIDTDTPHENMLTPSLV